MRTRALSSGSSPRLRGTGHRLADLRGHSRFIPAPAGNRSNHKRRLRIHPVHPRACGEQGIKGSGGLGGNGSSPRLRGTGPDRRPSGSAYRFIPAPAGNRTRPRRCCGPETVHPRACGEQVGSFLERNVANGSSPRLRGTGAGPGIGPAESRFIPAPAGNRSRGYPRARRGAVHPRACGEQSLSVSARVRNRVHGSSPRLRGTVFAGQSISIADRFRFIPAPAGNRSLKKSIDSLFRLRFIPAPAGNSFRSGADCIMHDRFIPAPAGNRVLDSLFDFAVASVHPRACGEQSNKPPTCDPRTPVHPRACGEQNYRSPLAAQVRIRFIPAPAGNSIVDAFLTPAA